jgi:hypothetical protein
MCHESTQRGWFASITAKSPRARLRRVAQIDLGSRGWVDFRQMDAAGERMPRLTAGGGEQVT